ncbi:hypothetical protein [Nocardia africana]
MTTSSSPLPGADAQQSILLNIVGGVVGSIIGGFLLSTCLPGSRGPRS